MGHILMILVEKPNWLLKLTHPSGRGWYQVKLKIAETQTFPEVKLLNSFVLPNSVSNMLKNLINFRWLDCW